MQVNLHMHLAVYTFQWRTGKADIHNKATANRVWMSAPSIRAAFHEAFVGRGGRPRLTRTRSFTLTYLAISKHSLQYLFPVSLVCTGSFSSKEQCVHISASLNTSPSCDHILHLYPDDDFDLDFDITLPVRRWDSAGETLDTRNLVKH